MRWIIGDIHGMLRPLDALIEAIHRRDWNPHFIFAGDYVNRGPDSRGVIDRALSLPNASFVRGNHDDIFDLVLHGDCYVSHETGSDAVSAFTWFCQHGLANTIESYGVDYAEIESVLNRPSAPRLQKLLAAVPESHREFIHGLPPIREFDDIFVAHAMWGTDERDEDMAQRLATNPQLRHRLLWGRFGDTEIRRVKKWKRTGFFGHTPVNNYTGGGVVPLTGPAMVLVDTGAALGVTGRLSAICAENGALVQSDRAGKLVEAA